MPATSIRGGAYKGKAGIMYLQVKLCDPCLSVLRLCVVQMALYKYSPFSFLLQQQKRQFFASTLVALLFSFILAVKSSLCNVLSGFDQVYSCN